MSFEERLSTSLARTLDRLEVPPGDVGAARSEGDRQRRQRNWTAGLAAAAVLAVVATGVALARPGDDDDGRLDPAPATSWTRLPDAPITPRTGGIAVWTGAEAIFLGGEIDNVCPPTADCTEPSTYAKDGAAYDPASTTWRSIAAAPVPVAAHTPHTMAGGTLVLVGDGGAWHAYDVAADRWRSLPTPPLDRRTPLDVDAGLSALDGRIYTVGGTGSVQVLDLGTDSWATLPESPHRPALEGQQVVATPEGIVLLGVDTTAKNDGIEPSFAIAEVYADETWQRLGHSEVLGSWGPWLWTGQRLVSPNLECFDGGQTNNYGRCIPSGGTLDPASGTWEPLPNLPSLNGGGWSLSAEEGDLIATWGYLYDDSAGTWTKLRRPDGAPDYSTAAVIADGTVIAFGGVDSDRGWDKDALTKTAWSWTP